MIGHRIRPRFKAEAKANQSHGQTAPGRTLSLDLGEASPIEPVDSATKAAKAVHVSPRMVEAASKVIDLGVVVAILAMAGNAMARMIAGRRR
jgi:hypothetical protein